MGKQGWTKYLFCGGGGNRSKQKGKDNQPLDRVPEEAPKDADRHSVSSADEVYKPVEENGIIDLSTVEFADDVKEPIVSDKESSDGKSEEGNKDGGNEEVNVNINSELDSDATLEKTDTELDIESPTDDYEESETPDIDADEKSTDVRSETNVSTPGSNSVEIRVNGKAVTNEAPCNRGNRRMQTTATNLMDKNGYAAIEMLPHQLPEREEPMR
jgi:hypothetical protein